MKFRVFAVLLSLASASLYATPVLRIFNWNNEIAPQTIKRFEQTCHCKVVEDYYGDNEEMLAKLAAGAKGYDIVVPSTYAMQALIKQNKLQPVNKEALSNYRNLDSAYLKLNAPFDPGNRHGVPLLASITVIGYNEKQLKGLNIPTDSWAAIFNPEHLEKLRGKITVLDSQRELFAAALMYLGKDPNSTNPKDWKAAANIIRTAKPYWAAFNNQSYIKELTVGNIWLAFGYSNDFFQAMNDAKAAKRPFAIGYQTQKEGNILGLDNMVILKDAPNTSLATQFINFMLEGKNAADVSNIIGSVNPNIAAYNYLTSETKKNPVIMANPAKQKLILLKDMNLKTRRELNRLWTELKVVN